LFVNYLRNHLILFFVGWSMALAYPT
jgi:hypothetical protein